MTSEAVADQHENKPAPQRGAQWSVFLALVVCLVTTGLLSSGRLVQIAERLPFGPGRDSVLAGAQTIDSMARSLGFHQPAALVDIALGPRDALPRFELPQTAQLAVAAEITPDLSLTPSPVDTPTLAPTAMPSPTIVPASLTPTSLPPMPTASLPTATPLVIPPPQPNETLPPTPATPAEPTAADTAVPPTPRPPTAPSQASATPLAASPTPAETPAPTAIVANPPPKAGLRLVTADQPLRVLTAGDSFAQPLGYELNAYANRYKMIVTQLDFKLSTGLTRPDFFDWPARLRAIMAQRPAPEVIVFVIGGNDTQNMWNAQRVFVRRTADWQEEYARRAADVMDIVGQGGARLFWVNMPIMRDPERNEIVKAMNEAVQVALEDRPWVHYVDTYTLFQDPDGAFATYLPDEKGEMVQVRQNDGVHLTWAGNGWVTALVYRALERDYGFEKP